MKCQAGQSKAQLRFALRRKQGLCPYCSGVPPIGQITCLKCRQRKLKHSKKRVKSGKCRKCNNTRLSGYTSCLLHMRKTRLNHKMKAEETRRLIDAHYGSECKCCGESIALLLTVDHINGSGNKHRESVSKGLGGTKFYNWLIKNNYPAGFQRLCFTCNNGRALNGGVCPHLEHGYNILGPESKQWQYTTIVKTGASGLGPV